VSASFSCEDSLCEFEKLKFDEFPLLPSYKCGEGEEEEKGEGEVEKGEGEGGG